MKLLIVTPAVDENDGNLGAFYYWFKALAEKFDEIAIIGSSVGEHMLPPNVRVYSLGKEKRQGKMRRAAAFFRIFAVQYMKTDAVLFHMMPEFALAASPFFLLRRKTKALWYAHGSVTMRLRLAERLVDYVFTSSEGGFRLASKKVFFLGQAVDTERFKPAGNGKNSRREFRMVTVGRVSPVKDYETILRACKLLKDWGREWSFSIIGGPILPRDHEYFERLKKTVKEFGIEGRVYFLGSRNFSEIPSLLREYDMFLNASKTGSLDKAVLEAMSCGLSVITANEAYKKLLPAKYFLDHISPQFLAERIKSLADEARPNMALREIVVRDHGLERTMEKMSAILHAKGNTFAIQIGEGGRNAVRG